VDARPSLAWSLVLVLALDTATSVVTVALAQVTDAAGSIDVLVERSGVVANRHAELLAPLVDEVLHAASVGPADIGAVCAGLGPGPFTGLRVGVVTAASLADGLQIPVYGACSLDMIAADVDAGGSPFAVATDARRKQVYWATYAGDRHRSDGPDLALPDVLADRLRGAVRTVAGPGATSYADDFTGFDVVDAQPRAGNLVALVADRVVARAPSDRLEPMYLRRPDARPPGPRKKVTPA
jgi:tRNA threonylcarbamoyl adenosine modification protein YeaZ